ncbi:MAG: orotidine-5'-phosphate decarboxylase [Bacteroidia bacterium]
MNRAALIQEIRTKKSFLCVGLDTDPHLLPEHLKNHPDGVFEFNKAIIDATKEFCVAYKINTAFFEAMGSKGWEIMERTFAYIPDNILKIADAKRGDIGNTSNQYARAFFEALGADCVTLAPYMGKDSLETFFKYSGKWGIILALTSNPGSADFEQQKLGSGEFLYQRVIAEMNKIGSAENLMYVVGATKPHEFREIRKQAAEHFLLVPGVGAQGGSLAEVCENGLTNEVGLLINASRSIIYASKGEDFAIKSAAEARKIQQEMETILAKRA